MRKLHALRVVVVCLVTLGFLSLLYADFLEAKGRSSKGGDVSVKGYTRKDGTYVRPHMRSKPDGNPYNNWSYPGNTNPYTGKTAPGNPDTYLDNYYKRRKNQLAPSYPSSSEDQFQENMRE